MSRALLVSSFHSPTHAPWCLKHGRSISERAANYRLPMLYGGLWWKVNRYEKVMEIEVEQFQPCWKRYSQIKPRPSLPDAEMSCTRHPSLCPGYMSLWRISTPILRAIGEKVLPWTWCRQSAHGRAVRAKEGRKKK